MGLHITASVASDSLDWMILNCYDIEDPTKAILLNLRCESAYGQGEKAVYIGHVWLQKRSSDMRLSPVSRLSLMDVDQAIKQTQKRELLIAKSWALKGLENITGDQCNIWLQILQPEGHDALEFEASEPKVNGQTTNLTWTLDRDCSPISAIPSALVISLCHPSGRRVGLRLAILDAHGYLGLRCDSSSDEDDKLQIAPKLWDRNKVALPFERHIQIGPGLAVAASLHRENLNGQEMYIVKVWTIESRVPYRRLKAIWHYLTGANRRRAHGGAKG